MDMSVQINESIGCSNQSFDLGHRMVDVGHVGDQSIGRRLNGGRRSVDWTSTKLRSARRFAQRSTQQSAISRLNVD